MTAAQKGALGIAVLLLPSALGAQTPVRDRLAALHVPELRFNPPSARSGTVEGVSLDFVEDRSLPLITVYATFKGGYSRLPRTYYAAASAVPALLRTGGTRSDAPETIDERIEFLALSMSFGQAGGSASSWINTLSENLDEAMALWRQMLREPRFDSVQVELWRTTELERLRRRGDDPGSLAFSRFNQIMYGDHPIGWEMLPSDLEREALSQESLRFVHEAVICPDNMAIGIVGDLTWERAQTLVAGLVDGWTPCNGALREEPDAPVRTDPGVFVLHKEIEQSVVVMAHSASVRQADRPEYFAVQIGNSILGASGFSSRLTNAVRTRAGLAYSAGSLWITPQKRDGLVGALTRTKPESTLAATRLILDVIDSMRVAPPEVGEVSLAVDEIVNGFVFNFQTPFQLVARSMAFKALELPDDWLERYLEGIQNVTPASVHDVFQRQVDPGRMTILLVGDTSRFDGSPSLLGDVTLLEEAPSSPRGSPQFHR